MDAIPQLLRSMPFIRLLLALIAGILIEWYAAIPIIIPAVTAAICVAICFVFSLLSTSTSFQYRGLSGISVILLFVALGTAIVYKQDIRNDKNALINQTAYTAVLVTIDEPLIEKTASYKALASADAIFINNKWVATKGKLLLYFSKKNVVDQLQYGSQVIIHSPLQLITNTGNPGGFDYKRYCLFQDITHQAFLQQKDFITTTRYNGNTFQKWLFETRDKVLQVFKQYVPGNQEAGVAEALLIGYRDDLDKALVQSYSNTGVVHIIAISGLHIGLIYAMLLFLFKPLHKRKTTAVLSAIIILIVIWLFTLLAGAAPSVLRSAVMFTFIFTGRLINRKGNVYNTLAASAFCMLVYNPFILWDVGFQLSYAAVISIMLFMRPIYNLVYCQNKMLDYLWKMNAVTFSAQVLTMPLILYYFHQFPLLFFITNIVVVPLSGFILFGELLLLIASAFKMIATFIGTVVFYMLYCMNHFILYMDAMKYAVCNNLQLSVMQVIIFYLFIICTAIWLLHKHKKWLIISSISLFVFCTIRTVDFIIKSNAQKIVVYNIPKHIAIDIFDGVKTTFIGDSAVIKDEFLYNFHLKPAHILNRVTSSSYFTALRNFKFTVHAKTVAFIHNNAIANKLKADVVIISSGPDITMQQIINSYHCTQVVFDCSNSLWKIQKWKKDCDSLHLRFHSVPEEGAFEMEL
jgi:competence protein ComEC